jgi:prepilin-type N-terminal cleavage/methylation domain-containing protein
MLSLRLPYRAGQRKGFTMLELIVVVAIIGILVGLLLPVLSVIRKRSRQSAARNAMSAIAMALDKYREDFGAYPWFDKYATGDDEEGSKQLAAGLCTRMLWGEMHYGPYLENVGSRLKDTGSPGKALVSPLGGLYQYVRLVDTEDKKMRRCLVVDAGPDGMFGGTIDPETGFVPNSETNSDGDPAHADNIYSSDQTK